VAAQLCAEFGFAMDRSFLEQPIPGPADPQLFAGSLSEADEKVVATARAALAQIAEALEAKMPTSIPGIGVSALLGGAEMLMRSEIAKGTPPSALMPSFVFLVALPLVDREEALELSQRTANLLEETMR
jgi:hypothetical protein